MASRLPKIPLRERNEHQSIAPAEQWDKIINVEILQLYPVFPWSVYGIGKPDLQLAVDTWNYDVDNASQKDYVSWHQDAIFCARMGLTGEAATITLKKLKMLIEDFLRSGDLVMIGFRIIIGEEVVQSVYKRC